MSYDTAMGLFGAGLLILLAILVFDMSRSWIRDTMDGE